MKNWKWWAVCIALAAAIAAYLNRDTFAIYTDQLQQDKKANHDLQEAERQRAAMLQERARLETPVGQEEFARKNGYHGKGERSVAVDVKR